ncbi:MAG: D-alanyl-D-alanine carboxypeptidase family protein [Leptolyngbyaceae cyanobacterium]
MAADSFGSDDIPEAQREGQTRLSDAPSSRSFWRWGLTIGAAALPAVMGGEIARPQPEPVAWTLRLADITTQLGIPPATTAESETLLGHRAYDEASVNSLVSVPSAPHVQLQPAAAAAVEAMVIAAQADGINLQPLSGFRSHADQQYLFFQIKADLGESALVRAEVSAPPGYSEHHTGYAVDFGDGNVPHSHVQTSFERTPAFRWLVQNAPRYNFELSFPKAEDAAVAYEPWHWRFVGDTDSLETFYQGR